MLPSFPNKGANRRRLLAMKEAGEALAESPQIFAAAPELLEALESIHTLASCAPHDDEERANKEFTRIMLTARAAIAKAKGQA